MIPTRADPCKMKCSIYHPGKTDVIQLSCPYYTGNNRKRQQKNYREQEAASAPHLVCHRTTWFNQLLAPINGRQGESLPSKLDSIILLQYRPGLLCIYAALFQGYAMISMENLFLVQS